MYSLLSIQLKSPFLPRKQFLRALQAHPIIAVVNIPSIKAEIAFLQLSLSLNPILYSPRAIRLRSLEPTRQKITNVWLTILILFLHVVLAAIVAFAQQKPVVFWKRLDEGQYFFNVLPDKLFVFSRIV